MAPGFSQSPKVGESLPAVTLDFYPTAWSSEAHTHGSELHLHLCLSLSREQSSLSPS